MSIEIRAKIICDMCGDCIEGKLQTSSTHGVESYADAKVQARRSRWMFNYRYGTTRHYCHKCADGAVAIGENVCK